MLKDKLKEDGSLQTKKEISINQTTTRFPNLMNKGKISMKTHTNYAQFFVFVLWFSFGLIINGCQDTATGLDEAAYMQPNDSFEQVATAHQEVVASSPKAAAWYVGNPWEIPILEKKGFNLFFIGEDFSNMTPAQQDSKIQTYLNALGPGSQIVLNIQPWLRRNWYTGALGVSSCPNNGGQPQPPSRCPVIGKTSAGLEEFINRWGGSDSSYPVRDRIYGFLLADDVQLTPLGPDCTSQPSNALWVVRWFYEMIRNKVVGQQNGCNRDLAPGKVLIVTMPFHPDFYNAQFGAHFNMNAFDVPPSFFTTGTAFDIVAPYYYPHMIGVASSKQLSNMSVVFSDIRRMFPTPNIRMPILQTAGGCDSGMEVQPDLRIQFNRMIAYGLGMGDAGIMMFTARWSPYCNTLLQYNGQVLATDKNPYYRAAGIINGYFLNRPIGPNE